MSSLHAHPILLPATINAAQNLSIRNTFFLQTFHIKIVYTAQNFADSSKIQP